MKAITLEQPFASLVCIGVKKIETRTWSTDYRGELAIHAGESIVAVTDPYHRSLLIEAGLDCDDLPHGKIIAIARLVSCRKVVPAEIPCYPELAFSDFIPGSYGFELTDIRALPVPVTASEGVELWEWDGNQRGLLR